MIIVIEKISAFIEENSLVSNDLEQKIAQHCVMIVGQNPSLWEKPMGIVGKTIYDVIFL